MTSTEIQRKIDEKTKPVGALGLLEELAFQIASLQQTLTPVLRDPTILVFAADHGIALEPVSAYPREVTGQMVHNFLQGGAAINVFCRANDIALKIIDAGIHTDLGEHPGLIRARIGKGTRNALHEPAMTPAEVSDCFDHATAIIENLGASNNVVGFGEMGIGNTSSAALLMSGACKIPVAECAGRGTGLSDGQLLKKIEILEQAQARHAPTDDPMELLATFGGYEIAQICGAMLAAWRHGKLILVDGFICSVAFLIAQRIQPGITPNTVFCHLSEEQGHRQLLHYLNAKPVLQLGMRLGEGSGCAVAWPIIQSSLAFFNEMASFGDANVSEKDPSHD